MASLPLLNVVPVHVALTLTGSDTHPTIGVPFWSNVMVPPSTLGDSVAVSVTIAPVGAGFADAVSVVVVASAATVRVFAENAGAEPRPRSSRRPSPPSARRHPLVTT